MVPCAAYLNGEYGVKDIYVGVPTVIGEKGVERIVEIELSGKDREGFDKSVGAVQGLIDACKKIAPDLLVAEPVGIVRVDVSKWSWYMVYQLGIGVSSTRAHGGKPLGSVLMNIHEYQAKALLAEFGVPVPRACRPSASRRREAAAKELPGPVWVVRQIHAGGRGKGRRRR